MGKKTEFFIGSLVAAALVLGSQSVFADENKNNQQSAEKAEAQAKTEKKDGEQKQFVDRDGDGIQDGMEHRFRRHKRFGQKSKWQGQGRQLRRAGKGHKNNGNNGGN